LIAVDMKQGRKMIYPFENFFKELFLLSWILLNLLSKKWIMAQNKSKLIMPNIHNVEVAGYSRLMLDYEVATVVILGLGVLKGKRCLSINRSSLCLAVP